MLSCFKITDLSLIHYVLWQNCFPNSACVWCGCVGFVVLCCFFFFLLSFEVWQGVPIISWCLHQMSTVHFCRVLLPAGLVRGVLGWCCCAEGLLSIQDTALLEANCGWASTCFTATSSCNCRRKSGVNKSLLLNVVQYNIPHPLKSKQTNQTKKTAFSVVFIILNVS